MHLVVAERIDEVGAAALVISEHLERSGFQERALALLVDALAITRASDALRMAERVALRMALVALADGNEIAMQQAHYELQPARTRGINEELIAPARQLIDDALRGARLGAAAGAPVIDDPSRYPDAQLATWYWTLKVRAARAAPIETERAVVAAACAWARMVGGPFTLAHERAWLARLAYRECEWGRAAELNTAVAESRALPFVLRLSARTNAASALMELGRFDDAVATADETSAAAAACRHAYFELRGLWIARSAAFRRGDALEPDPELPTLAEAVGVPYLEALLHLTEAAICWRRSAWVAMADHARLAAERAGRLKMEALERFGQLLHWAATRREPSEPPGGWYACITAWPTPGLRLQGLALLAVGLGRLCPEGIRVAREAFAACPRDTRRHRLDVMSAEECSGVVEAFDDGGTTDQLPSFVRDLVFQRGGAVHTGPAA